MHVLSLLGVVIVLIIVGTVFLMKWYNPHD